MKHRSLQVNAILNSLRTILNIIFPIITFPYVSRVLGVRGIGIYNFSNSIVSYFLLIAALGINTYAIREGARIRENKVKINDFANQVFTINICSMIVAYIFLFLCLAIFVPLRKYMGCILIFSVQIFFTTIGLDWIYQIYEDYAYITIRSIIFQIISLILLFIFVRNRNDYLVYAAITVFSAVGANVLNFIHSRKYCHIKIVFHVDWKKHMLPIMILFFTAISNMIYLNSDVTILGLMKNAYVVGIYSVSAKVYSIVKTVISAVLIVTVPRLAMLFGEKRIKEYENILSDLTKTLIVLTIPASIGLFMISRGVVLLVAGEKYLQATTSLKILCFAYIFCILSWILNDCVLIPARREKYVLVSMTTSAVLNVVFNLVFIPSLNENAAAISTVLAEFCMMVMNYYYSRDIVKHVFLSKDIYKDFFSSLIGGVGIVIICLFCDKVINSIILNTIVSILLSVIVYAIILLILKNEIVITLFKKTIFSKFNRNY